MRNILLLVMFSIILAGCGTSWSNNNEDQSENRKTNGSGEVMDPVDGHTDDENNDNGENTGIVEGELIPNLSVTSPLVYKYGVANNTDNEVTLEFSSSQRFDYSVETKEGEQVHLFSSVASFMQALGKESINPGEDLEYEINLNALSLEVGDYVLKAWLTPIAGKNYEVSHEFTVTE